MIVITRLLIAIGVVAGLAVVAGAGLQKPEERPLPPASWSCPMHPDVVEDAKGICPICKMDLTPVRIDAIWSCPVHSVVADAKPGKCPICRRELGQVTVAVSWTCPDRPDIDQSDPGKCADGSPMVRKHVPRAHGNHNPQHGGLFFMAPDNWHHLEGTYPEQGVFRLHLYNDYTKPLDPEKVKQATGRVVTKETFDSATRTANEIAAFPLTLAASGQYLEAKIDPLAPPAQMTAKITLAPDGPEHRFDFAFPAFSKEPVIDTTAAAAAGIDPSQLMFEIPDNPSEVLAQLTERNQQLRGIIERGAFAEVWVPALQSKDLALALDEHAKDLPADRRKVVAPATKRLVIAAWRLDAYGDLGNRDRIVGAYKTFSEAVAELETAFGR